MSIMKDPEIWYTLDDFYDRNVTCVSLTRDACDKMFDDHNDELKADGFQPHPESDRKDLVQSIALTGDLTIYYCVAGYYSGQSVVGACLQNQLEEMQAFVDRLNAQHGDNFFHIEKVTLGLSQNTDKTYYGVRLPIISDIPDCYWNTYKNVSMDNLENFLVPKVEVYTGDDIEDFNEYGMARPEIYDLKIDQLCMTDGSVKYLYVYTVRCYATDDVQALKIATEALSQYLYEKRCNEPQTMPDPNRITTWDTGDPEEH